MTRSDIHARLLRIQHAIYVGVRALCVTLLALIVIAISAAVLARFVIFTPLNFADPLSKYLMQWMAYIKEVKALNLSHVSDKESFDFIQWPQKP